jgi:molybdopterin/thiamine biosynthesis adenylyltransferase
MVILPNHIVALVHGATPPAEIPIVFVSVDEGDAFVYESLTTECGKGRRKVSGLLRSVEAHEAKPKEMPPGIDVLVVARTAERVVANENGQSPPLYDAWVRVSEDASLVRRPVKIIEFDKEIFSRIHGLYETDVLQAKTVLIIGIGSGGSSIAIELAKAGVGQFILADHDRLEIANLVRHICGLSDLGRFKTKAVRDQILGKNPSAQVETLERQIDWDYLPNLRELVRRVDLVFCCTDNRASRMLINLACVSERRVCIYGGTLNRAYGGHVLRVNPTVSMCYQCFVDLLPEKADDQEVGSQEQANRVAYDDRAVPVEPGLANDIAPIAVMCVKFGILELLRGTETSLSSLYEDLSNAWYLWLNRREVGTDYAGLNPLDTEGSEDLRILAWYGVANDRDPACPVCGDFTTPQLRGDVLTAAEIEVFAPTATSEAGFMPVPQD